MTPKLEDQANAAKAEGAGMARAAPRKSVLEQLQVIVPIVLGVVAAASAWQLNRSDEALKTVMAQATNREAERKDAEAVRFNRESLEKTQLTVYEAVVKSIESENAKKQKVAIALVTSILQDPLRTQLLAVLSESGVAEVKKETQATLARESTFKAEEETVVRPAATRTSNWHDWDFDIFWCERSGDFAKRQAEQLAAALKNDNAKGRVRARLLPDSLNARDGYRNTGYVIRYGVEEEAQAKALKGFGEQALGVPTFALALSRQNTPWYISAFICPGSVEPR